MIVLKKEREKIFFYFMDQFEYTFFRSSDNFYAAWVRDETMFTMRSKFTKIKITNVQIYDEIKFLYYHIAIASQIMMVLIK